MSGSSITWKQDAGDAPVPAYDNTLIPSTAAPAVRQHIEQIESGYFFLDQNTPESLAYMIEYYRKRAPWGRVAFRASGVLIIAIGALLPFIAGMGDRLQIFGWRPDKDIVVSVMALALAILTGLNQFFRWDERWKGNTQSLFRLQRLRATWQLEKVRALQIADPQAAIEALTAAAERLVQHAHEIAGEEMETFFRLQMLPDRSAPDHKP